MTKQSTEKPVLNEMRLISGTVKIWNGKEWVKDRGQFYERPVTTVKPISKLQQAS